jgi:hypothetical protein
MWASGDYIYVLEKDGTLYKVDAESGEYERFGDAGAYSDTVAATVHDGHFYAIEDDGAVGVTSLEDGSYVEHDDEDLRDVKHLFSTSRRLYAIHRDGTLSTLAFD